MLRGADTDEERVSNSEEEKRIEKAKAKGWSKSRIDSEIINPYRTRHRNTHIGNVVERIEGTDIGLVKTFSKSQNE